MKKMFLTLVMAMAVSVSFGSELINRVGQHVHFNCPK